MSVEIFNKEIFEKLQQDSLANSPSKNKYNGSLRTNSQYSHSAFGSKSSQKNRGINTESMARLSMKQRKIELHQEATNQQVALSIKENIVKRNIKRDAYYMKLCRDIDDGNELSDELQNRIDLQNKADDRQKQKLYEEWEEEVYNKLNKPVHQKLVEMNSKELNDKKRLAYQRFLDTTNKKGALFRDIILESEYNPLNDNRPIKYTHPVDDPCVRVLRRREEENDIKRKGSAAIKHTTGQSKQSNSVCNRNGRSDNLDPMLWSTGTFESTPYGYFTKMMNSTASANSSKTYESRVYLDHYNTEVGEDAMKGEIPKGKKTDYGADIRAKRLQLKIG